MLRRIPTLLLLVLAAACGEAPPPPAEAPAPATAAPATTPPPSDTKADAKKPDTAPPPEPAAPAGDAKKPADAAPGKASTTTDTPISASISQNEIIAQVQKNADVFNRCYTIGAGSSKGYRAKVTVKATVGPTGSVNVVQMLNSTAKNPKVDACVVEGFKKLTFARPQGAGTTVFTFPLSFDGLEQAP